VRRRPPLGKPTSSGKRRSRHARKKADSSGRVRSSVLINQHPISLSNSINS
jgi:hypothetical protein